MMKEAAQIKTTAKKKVVKARQERKQPWQKAAEYQQSLRHPQEYSCVTCGQLMERIEQYDKYTVYSEWNGRIYVETGVEPSVPVWRKFRCKNKNCRGPETKTYTRDNSPEKVLGSD